MMQPSYGSYRTAYPFSTYSYSVSDYGTSTVQLQIMLSDGLIADSPIS